MFWPKMRRHSCLAELYYLLYSFFYKKCQIFFQFRLDKSILIFFSNFIGGKRQQIDFSGKSFNIDNQYYCTTYSLINGHWDFVNEYSLHISSNTYASCSKYFFRIQQYLYYLNVFKGKSNQGPPLSSEVLVLNVLNMCERRNVSIYGSDNYLDVASNV